jgi:hypothetical protein
VSATPTQLTPRGMFFSDSIAALLAEAGGNTARSWAVGMASYNDNSRWPHVIAV